MVPYVNLICRYFLYNVNKSHRCFFETSGIVSAYFKYYDLHKNWVGYRYLGPILWVVDLPYISIIKSRSNTILHTQNLSNCFYPWLCASSVKISGCFPSKIPKHYSKFNRSFFYFQFSFERKNLESTLLEGIDNI